jgi:hypothetical protein
MADIGEILEVENEDGQLVARVDCGWGQQISAVVQQSAGCDFYPLKGDRVVFHRTSGSEIVITAIFASNSGVEKGEWKIASRNQAGTVAAVFHLKADGSIAITNGTGKLVNVGGAGGFVAMAQKVDLLWSTLWTCFNSWAPVAQDGGAALRTAFLAAFPSTPQSTASTNLKAD